MVVPAGLTCDTLGGLERVRVADLGVCRCRLRICALIRLGVGPGPRRRSGGSAPWDPAVGLSGRPGVGILL